MGGRLNTDLCRHHPSTSEGQPVFTEGSLCVRPSLSAFKFLCFSQILEETGLGRAVSPRPVGGRTGTQNQDSNPSFMLPCLRGCRFWSCLREQRCSLRVVEAQEWSTAKLSFFLPGAFSFSTLSPTISSSFNQTGTYCTFPFL